MDADALKFLSDLKDDIRDKIEASSKDLRATMDAKSGELHSRMSKMEAAQLRELHVVTNDQNRRIGELHAAFVEHKAAPCPDVKEHERQHHGSSNALKQINQHKAAAAGGSNRLSMKLIAVITALVTLASTLAAIVAALVKSTPSTGH